MKVVFFGTPQFSADVLSYLLEHHVEIVAVVTRTDKPKGRTGHPVPTAVKKLVLEKAPSIPIFQPEKVSSPEFTDVLPAFDADLFVVVAYGEIVKQHILDMPKMGCINLHTSLLPKYRGAAPIQRCIINGESETGVSIMYMVKKMDAGDIIESVKVPIGPNDMFGNVEKKLCEKGAELLLRVIQDFEKNGVTAEPQEESLVTFAPKIELEDCEIDWSLPAQKIHNLVRGVNPYPGAWCYVEVKGSKKRLKIKASRVDEDNKGAPGEILSCDSHGMIVGCGENALRITELQLEGKKPMSPDDLLRGTTFSMIS